jgi:Leucine-rich repeat (LRR) protein
MRFSLRSVFLATILLCATLAIFAQVVHDCIVRTAAVKALEDCGARLVRSDGDPSIVTFLQKTVGINDSYNIVKVSFRETEWPLNAGGRPNEFQGGNGAQQVTQISLAISKIAALSEVQAIDLSETDICDSDLTCLSLMPALKELSLAGTRITDKGISELLPAAQLESLTLSGTQVSDTGMATVAKIQSLRQLVLGKIQVEGEKGRFYEAACISDAGLKLLTQLPRIEDLSINGTDIHDSGMQSLSVLHSLRKLDIRNTSVTDEGLDSIAKLRKLETLLLCDLGDSCGLSNTAVLRLRTKLKTTQIQFDDSPALFPNVHDQ